MLYFDNSRDGFNNVSPKKFFFVTPEILFLYDNLYYKKERKDNIVFYQKIWIKIFLFLVILFPNFSEAKKPDQTEDSYKIGSGDLLTISVWAGEHLEEDMKGEYLVLESGVIEMPLIGDIDIGGKTEEQATNAKRET